jgi:hypothetical protein
VGQVPQLRVRSDGHDTHRQKRGCNLRCTGDGASRSGAAPYDFVGVLASAVATREPVQAWGGDHSGGRLAQARSCTVDKLSRCALGEAEVGAHLRGAQAIHGGLDERHALQGGEPPDLRDHPLQAHVLLRAHVRTVRTNQGQGKL